MNIEQIAAKNSRWSRVVVAEVWLKNFARETSPDDVFSEFGFAADANGEYTLTADQAEIVWGKK